MLPIGKIKSKTILIAGVGHLGSQIAMMSAAELEPKRLVLYDIKDLTGDILDLRHACEGLGLSTKITERIEPSDYVIITAGKPRRVKGEETDDTLYADNRDTVFKVLEGLRKKGTFKKSTCLIVMTNPVLRVTEAVAAKMTQNRVYNPERLLMESRKGKELGWKIIQTKGYTNFGAAVACVRLIDEIEKNEKR
jgi:malate/lactate dehydrogenase